MRVQLPLRGPVKWLVILAFVWAYPVALVYGFAPDSEDGRNAGHILAYYFGAPFLLLILLAGLNLVERAWKSWGHWQRVPHQPGITFLLGEEVTTLFKGEHLAPHPVHHLERDVLWTGCDRDSGHYEISVIEHQLTAKRGSKSP